MHSGLFRRILLNPAPCEFVALARGLAGTIAIVGEEVVASIVGAFISLTRRDRDSLEGKATFELIAQGNEPFAAAELVQSLVTDLERYL